MGPICNLDQALGHAPCTRIECRRPATTPFCSPVCPDWVGRGLVLPPSLPSHARIGSWGVWYHPSHTGLGPGGPGPPSSTPDMLGLDPGHSSTSTHPCAQGSGTGSSVQGSGSQQVPRFGSKEVVTPLPWTCGEPCRLDDTEPQPGSGPWAVVKHPCCRQYTTLRNCP